MALSEAQKRAQNKYNREKVHPMAVRFYPAEEELWQHVTSFDNRSAFVKDAVRDDLLISTTDPSSDMGIEELALYLAHCEPGSEKFDAAAAITAKKLAAYDRMQNGF